MRMHDIVREADAQHSDSIWYWKQRHNEAVDKWVRLDSLVMRLMRENDELRAEVKRLKGET